MAVPGSERDEDPRPEGQIATEATPSRSPDWAFSIGIRLFQAGKFPVDPAFMPDVDDIPAGDPLPGHLCQAARMLLGISQAELRERSMVSKKSINDFENGFAAIGDPLVAKLRTVLEGEGARFVTGNGVTGVLTVKARTGVDRKSRSPRKAGA